MHRGQRAISKDDASKFEALRYRKVSPLRTVCMNKKGAISEGDTSRDSRYSLMPIISQVSIEKQSSALVPLQMANGWSAFCGLREMIDDIVWMMDDG